MSDQERFIKTLKGYQRIVINICHGGFGLSELALDRYKKYTGTKHIYDREIARDDPALVKVVEELGADSYGSYAKLKVVEIPGDVEWQIDEYDGDEWVAEQHRTWR